jgi:hypothetical protein
MQCNIDKRGQNVRMAMGIFSIVVAVILFVLTFFQGWSPWLYLVAAFALLGGAFAIFESRKKWCALRAMGVRTPV